MLGLGSPFCLENYSFHIHMKEDQNIRNSHIFEVRLGEGQVNTLSQSD